MTKRLTGSTAQYVYLRALHASGAMTERYPVYAGGRRYRDARGMVHATRFPRMTILLCEETDGHRDYGPMVSDEEDPTIEVVTCLECVAR